MFVMKTALIFWFSFAFMKNLTKADRPERNSVPKLIQADGYSVEMHQVTTEDGYILDLTRIPGAKNESIPSGGKPVAFLTLCILCSSMSFLMLGHDSLAYLLVNNGYDVWILSNRGTIASQRHVQYSPNSREFWYFSFHEMGIYDLPASLDYVLKLTGESQVDYIGFSMGVTQFFVLLSERPEYSKKIRKMMALSPAAFFRSNTSPIFPVHAPLSNMLTNYGAESGRLRFPPSDLHLNKILPNFCSFPGHILFGTICSMILTAVGAADNGNINYNMLPFYLQHYPDQTSIRSMVHYAQLRSSGKFEKYNFGRRMNQRMYGSAQPPSYNFSQVTVPINIFWSMDDPIVTYKDVALLESYLPNVQSSYQVPFESFSHLDFIWGNNAPTLVYKVVMEKLLLDRT